jgi:transcriptional regulator with XRE-family HTH domain
VQAKKTESLENFAVRLKAAMKRRDLKLHSVAEFCGVSTSTVGAWTQGLNWPQVEAQPKLAQCLGLSVQFIIHGIPDEPETSSSSVLSAVAEPRATYGGEGDLTEEIGRHHQSLLLAAKGDPVRLGWIREQQQAHLAIPAHWLAAQVKAPAATPKAQRRRTKSGLVPVILPSQKILLSTHTGLPVASPSHGARSA